MRRFFAGCVLALAVSASPLAAQHEQHRPQHEQSDPTQQSFADVERFRRIFESSARDEWQKPEEVIGALAIQPGMTIADIGAGTGYFARRFAVAVGPQGTVYAADLEPKMVTELRDRADQDQLPNVVPVLASADNPRLPDGAADVIFICDTWHHIAGRVNYARQLRQDLAPGGRVVIVDFYKGPLPVGPPPEHKLSREEVEADFHAAGYRLVAAPDILPHQYVLVFQPLSD